MKLSKGLAILVGLAVVSASECADALDYQFGGKLTVTGDPQPPQIPPGQIVTGGLSFPTDYVDIRFPSSNITRTPDIVYDATNNFAFDMYTPNGATNTGNRCAVIWTHGAYGNKYPEGEYIFMGDLSANDIGPANRGYIGFSVGRRPSGDFFGAVADFQRAVDFIRSHAATYKIDLDCTHVSGFSEGGSIAISYGMNNPPLKNQSLWVLNTQLNGAFYADWPTVASTNVNDPIVPPGYLNNLMTYLNGKGIYGTLLTAPEQVHGPFSTFREVRVRQADFASHMFIASEQETRTGIKAERKQISAQDDEIIVGITSAAGATFDLIASPEFNSTGKSTPDGKLYLNENKLTTVFSNGTIPDGTNGLSGTGLGTIFISIKPIARALPAIGFQAKLRNRGGRAKNVMTNLAVTQ